MDILITCEHASNAIPKQYASLFDGQEALLNSHRGFDPGAAALADAIAKKLKAPLIMGTTSRLLVELNRTLSHPKLFSSFIPEELRTEILEKYYFPYVDQVKAAIKGKKKILHLSIHSFTPIYEGCTRKADIGILYDPKREQEKVFAGQWQKGLKREHPAWMIGKNTPYRGTSDGLVVELRSLFGEPYIGIELEMNQKHIPFEPAPILLSLDF